MSIVTRETWGAKMADLPTGRTIDETPFKNCGVDMFGPFLIKKGISVVASASTRVERKT